jgi:hypothetical protein
MFTYGYSEHELRKIYEKGVDFETGKRKSYAESETDKNGNAFISEEDSKRLAMDTLPEEEEAKQKEFEEWQEEFNVYQRKAMTVTDEKIQNLREMTNYMLPFYSHMRENGTPVEAFKFKPSEEYKDIDEFIKNLNEVSDIHNYEKSKDETGQDIIIKLIKKKKKFDFKKMLELDPSTIEQEVKEYLLANGIALEDIEPSTSKEDYLQWRANRNPDTDVKINELLAQKYGNDFVQTLVSDNIDMEEFQKEALEYIEYLDKEEMYRPMDKDDFIKWGTKDYLNIRTKKGTLVKSKYKVA